MKLEIFVHLAGPYHLCNFQVSLRDPLRAGVNDLGLKEIIGTAV